MFVFCFSEVDFLEEHLTLSYVVTFKKPSVFFMNKYLVMFKAEINFTRGLIPVPDRKTKPQNCLQKSVNINVCGYFVFGFNYICSFLT